MRILIVAAAITACACGPVTEAGGIPEYSYEIVHTYPHDRLAFTEGLFYLNGFLYESTGLPEQSSVRKVRLETGEVVQKHDLPGEYFGEGIIAWKDRLIQMTYTTQVGFVYDLATFTVHNCRMLAPNCASGTWPASFSRSFLSSVASSFSCLTSSIISRCWACACLASSALLPLASVINS
ncbi:MAG: glutaminyl-peptide cyclotransferase, partial [Acidobacteriia bacterium]|nr:glutaminyl-peptide cyclotransferase [Terriglobia bacterium]